MSPLRHFRFVRLDEDAGDTAVSVMRVSPDKWPCLVCGDDDNAEEFCHTCSTRRGEWVCPSCAHKNKSGSKCCEECGGDKDDA